MADEKITCPRRMEEFGPWERTEGLDRYIAGGGLVGQSRCCSFCGSLPPDDFMSLVRTGAMIEPTDKDYKAYIRGETQAKFYYQHLDEAQKREFIGLLNAKRINIGYPGRFYVLPFFVRVESESGRG